MRLVKSLVRAGTRARELATAKHARSGAPVIARRPSGIFEVENHSSLPHLLYATRRWNTLTARRVLVPSVLPLCVVVLDSVSPGDGRERCVSTHQHAPASKNTPVDRSYPAFTSPPGCSVFVYLHWPAVPYLYILCFFGSWPFAYLRSTRLELPRRHDA